jgi:type I restriction enzyme, R subunit
MTTVGQKEKETQSRVIKLFREQLGYDYLGDWTEREGNGNIEETWLRKFLREKQGFDEPLITRALHELNKAGGDTGKSLYDRNLVVYELLRYGVKVKSGVGEQFQTVWLIDWKNPEENHFAVAEEVSLPGADVRAHGKRPDVVLYINGIALGVLELKRSTVSVAEGIRQNLDNQKKIFIQPFFSTVQWVMAGNDTEGLRYGTIETPEKYYLKWKEDGTVENPLDRALIQLLAKPRFLELVHDFVLFDAGTKKLCRHNQYFALRESQEFVKRREGGIIWNTQGSGKSLIMVWLAKWIREHVTDPRVLIITDRTELDEQIEKVFKGVREDIYRTKSGADLIATLNATMPWLMCSLIHKFGSKEEGEEVGDIPGYIRELRKALPRDFAAKGNLFVFVDECHRTQSGELHEAMKAILPAAVFIGFTGTPLLKADKKKSVEVFGRYIHTYKFNEAVQDGVVLDLRYEARDIDQRITSQAKIDQWFEAKTRGLTDLAKAQLKQRWGTMQKVLSSRSRLEQIVADILMDMETRDRLKSGRGNAMIVSGSVYQACKLYELFNRTDLKGHCAIITSYRPSTADLKGEDAREGEPEQLQKYAVYQQMLADWFGEAPEKVVTRVEEFEKKAKEKFIKEPGQLKLMIVVDKLLTGFDAPPATYLYIDKEMRDHGLFQAICRVNRLDGDDKEYGYIIDYKDLFKSLEGAVHDYTSGALDGYDQEDVAGLLEDRLSKARERLEETYEAVKALCEPVEPLKDSAAYLRYFCAKNSGDAEQLKANEPNRLALYKHVAAFVRAYANLANELTEAGYSPEEVATLKFEVNHYEKVRNEVKLASGDYIDLKMYEPAMRHLIDTYIHAGESEKLSAFDDLSLIQLIVERGPEAVEALPEGLRKNRDTVAEIIENNVRKLIIEEQPINPRYYEKMSELLDALIKQRRQEALEYRTYLERIVALTKKVKNPESAGSYPSAMNTPSKRALYDNLGEDEALALAVDGAVRSNRQDDWRGNNFKVKKIKNAIRETLEKMGRLKAGSTPYQVNGREGSPENPAEKIESMEERLERILSLVKNQDEY